MASGRQRARRITGAQPDARAPRSFGPGTSRAKGYRKRRNAALLEAERQLPKHPNVRAATYSSGGLRVSLHTGEDIMVRSIEDLNDLKRRLAKPAE